MSHHFEVCRKCSGAMAQISEENKSPLVMECKKCGHREYAEVQVSSPWPPAEDYENIPLEGEQPKRSRADTEGGRRTAYDPSGAPVSVGDPEDGGKVIPVGWILLPAIILLLVLIIWFL